MNEKLLIPLAVLIVALGSMYLHEVRSREALIIESVIGVSARCHDGMYSTSGRDGGTCSRHGGVDYWISGGEK